MSARAGSPGRHGYLVKKIEQSLFNLDEDLGETKDAAAKHPDVVQQLQATAGPRADLGDSLTKRQYVVRARGSGER